MNPQQPQQQDLEVDAALTELLGNLDEVLHAAADPVELRSDEDVSFTEVGEARVPLGAVGELAAELVDVHPLAAGGAERVELRVEVLAVGADPGVLDRWLATPACRGRSVAGTTLDPPRQG